MARYRRLSIEELISASLEVSLDGDEMYRSYRSIMKKYGLNDVAAIKDGSIDFWEGLVVVRELLSRSLDCDPKALEKARICAQDTLSKFRDHTRDADSMSESDLIQLLGNG